MNHAWKNEENITGCAGLKAFWSQAMTGTIIILYICFVLYIWILLRAGSNKATPKIENRMTTTSRARFGKEMEIPFMAVEESSKRLAGTSKG